MENNLPFMIERQMTIENCDIWQMRKEIREKRTDRQMLQIMICDDETVSLSFLERTVREWAAERKWEVKISLYQSAEQFLFDSEDQEEADILLLDIDMPGLSGIDLAHRLRREGKRAQIIFVTGLADYMLEGYEKEKNDLSNQIKMGVLQHHEKMNAKGYPMGVGADSINIFARIISVADIYDALVTERPYKKPFSPRDAVEMIMSMTEELDISIMRSFLESVILYPVGTDVELSTGESARVVENNPKYVLRPKVVGIKTGKTYDLSDIQNASIVII